ncbi:lyase [Lentzea sp. NBRC 105346]|uniref:chondroitinase-B domain-containing protein n=1 Tax=Lentzea sp. NBRC 105346 TaxID=3032205 RepID=UPI0024A402B7|nr:chondroitinase-B domain-containing protein [Lentzea sp. NBRC 105346]GLZ33216.1 lyase [Lentzea sp. NBRC 105346]
MRLFTTAAILLSLLTTTEAHAGPCTRVATDAELQAAVAKPGCVRVEDGTYAALTISANDVHLKARKRLGAGFTAGTVIVTGSNVTVEGFTFTGGANFRLQDSVGSRITRSRFASSAAEFVQVFGQKGDRNRVDHNELGPKAQQGHMVQVGKNPYTPTNTLVDHNYLHDLAFGVQGGEALRVGGFGPPGDYFHAHTVFEYNLLVHCDGDQEVLSLKSSANVFRYNTVRASTGEINIRAGQANEIHGNFVFADGVKGAHGIRLSEDDHKIYNNYVETVEDAFLLFPGDEKPGNPPPGVPPSGPFTGHAQVRNAVVAGNTFITTGRAVDFGGGVKPPDNLTFVNNLIRSDGLNVGNGATPTNSTFRSNLLFGGEPGVSGPGFVQADPKLVRRDGLLRPGWNSPALRAGVAGYTRDDVLGRKRLSPPDIGAIEASAWWSHPRRAPLTPADVGPWS